MVSRHRGCARVPYVFEDGRPAKAIAGALAERCRAGMKANVLLDAASRSTFGRLLKNGIQIYEYRPALLHAKTMVIDGVWATIGSTNLDQRSFALNEELNVAVYDAHTAQRLEKVFAQDLESSSCGRCPLREQM